jgi:cell wall-associated NlpC family hydrolase
LKDRNNSVSHHAHVSLRRLALMLMTALAFCLTLVPVAAQAAPGTQAGLAAPAKAVPPVKKLGAVARAAYAARMRSYRIVAAAKSQQGKPYRFGATGPASYDCSGLTGFAYRTQHVTLPRTADQQYRSTRHIPASAARPGDLVFWVSGGHAHHVAVYAGAGKVWHAPHTGSRVSLTAIWSWSEVRFGRVGI